VDLGVRGSSPRGGTTTKSKIYGIASLLLNGFQIGPVAHLVAHSGESMIKIDSLIPALEGAKIGARRIALCLPAVIVIASYRA
jgi:hypothetical protein